ncbi:cytochrome C oxidase subunit IV family protein [Mycobacterium sp. NPDC003323]
MTTILRNPLTLAWAALTVVTVVSWLTARGTAAAPALNATVTIVVLLIAAAKTQLVIWYFMEVRHAPGWLRIATGGWVLGLFAALLGCYFAAL